MTFKCTYIPTLNAKISQTRIRIRIRIRKDPGAGSGSEITPQYDPGPDPKLIVFGSAILF